MTRILQAVAILFPEIGYCQGMNFVTGSLLHMYKDELSTFLHLFLLLEKHEMKNLYKPGVPELHFKNFLMS